LAGAVGVEFGHVKRAAVENVPVRGAILTIDSVLCDEFIDIVKTLIIALIDDESPVLIDDLGGALMFEAAHGRPLHGRRIRVEPKLSLRATTCAAGIRAANQAA
jgi:hypothetical protein